MAVTKRKNIKKSSKKNVQSRKRNMKSKKIMRGGVDVNPDYFKNLEETAVKYNDENLKSTFTQKALVEYLQKGIKYVKQQDGSLIPLKIIKDGLNFRIGVDNESAPIRKDTTGSQYTTPKPNPKPKLTEVYYSQINENQNPIYATASATASQKYESGIGPGGYSTLREVKNFLPEVEPVYSRRMQVESPYVLMTQPKDEPTYGNIAEKHDPVENPYEQMSKVSQPSDQWIQKYQPAEVTYGNIPRFGSQKPTEGPYANLGELAQIHKPRPIAAPRKKSPSLKSEEVQKAIASKITGEGTNTPIPPPIIKIPPPVPPKPTKAHEVPPKPTKAPEVPPKPKHKFNAPKKTH